MKIWTVVPPAVTPVTTGVAVLSVDPLAGLVSTGAAGAGGPATVIVTVAALEVARPLETVKVKLSAPI